MAERRTVPPLSGEIMAGAETIRAARFDASGASDGDFEIVGARSPVRPDQNLPPRPAESVAAGKPAGMAVLNEPAPPPAPRERAGPLFWCVGATVAAAAFWTAGGHALFAHAATPPDAENIHIAALTTRIVAGEHRQTVLVDGELLNEGSRDAAVPSLDIAVTGRDGAVTRYVLGTSGDAIAPGARYAFSSRLDAPRAGADAVLVTVRRKDSGG